MRRLRSLLAHRHLARFARGNGLVYFGRVHRDDEHTPLGGFTVSTTQVDDGYMTGSIQGQSVTIVRRTVFRNGPGRRAPHTWLIACIPLAGSQPPHCLLLSHEHPRDVVEAAALHADRAELLAIDPRLDARFLIFGHRADIEQIRDYCNDALRAFLIAQPAYDYEFCNGCVYTYRRTEAVDQPVLNGLLQTALGVANAYVGH